MDPQQSAMDILEAVGGASNIQDVSHCFTRLRLVLVNPTRADKQAISRIEGVVQIIEAQGQFQIVLGAKVTKVYDALQELLAAATDNTNASTGSNSNAKSTPATQIRAASTLSADKTGKNHMAEPMSKDRLNKILQVVGKMFTPLIPAIAASGLIKGLLTAASLILKPQGIDITTSSTYVLLLAASQVIFYFMPIFLGYTAAKALKCNEIIAMMLGAFLCYPQVDALIQNVAAPSDIFGLPVIKAAWTIGDSTRVFSYTESVIPIILAVLALSLAERFLKKYIPEMLQIILVPGLSLLVMLPATLVVLGPIGIFVGNGIQTVYNALVGFNAMLGGAVIGGLWGVLVIFGAHRALLPIGLNDVAVSGRQNLLAFAGAANFAQGGAALGVMLKTKNKNLKGVAASSVISAVLVGITEPAIYGCNLRLKKPMICAIICGALGGSIMGLGGVYGDAFANNGILTIFTYAAFGLTTFIFYVVGCFVAFVGAAVLTMLVGFEDIGA